MQVADFKTIVFRQQLLGFNAVRLPFTFSNLNLTPKIWTKACTDDTAYLEVTTPCASAHQSAAAHTSHAPVPMLSGPLKGCPSQNP